MKIEFGKYKGYDLHDVPENYLLWMIRNSQERIDTFQNELQRRENELEANADFAVRIIKSGFRELSKKLHPDMGGSAAEFQELTAAYEKLKSLYF